MTISATVLRLFVEALEELQLDWRALLDAYEIDAELLRDPDARISQVRFERVWVEAQEMAGDPCIGLHAGEQINAHAVNLFGYLMLSSATLGAGVARVARYQQVIAGVPWVELDETSDPSRLRVGASTGSDEFRAIHAEYVAALVTRFMRWVSEIELAPEIANFRHEARGPLSHYTRVLGCDVKFGMEQNELVFSAETLAHPSRHAEESLSRLHEEYAERLLARVGDKEMSQRVHHILAESLESGETTLYSVARQLGLSARSLQRRLSNEGTTFREILDGLRCEVARENLKRCQTPIAGVAHLAGFSDVSAFTRAASRWFGATPARLRALAGRHDDSQLR